MGNAAPALCLSLAPPCAQAVLLFLARVVLDGGSSQRYALCLAVACTLHIAAACASSAAVTAAPRAAAVSGAAAAARRTEAAEAAVTRVLLADYALLLALSLAAQASAASASASASAAAAAYAAPHLLLAFKWVALTLPVRYVVLPEAARTLCCLAAALARHGAPAAPLAALAGFAAATAAYLLVLLAVGFFHNRMFEERFMPFGLDACPQPLAPAVDAACALVERWTFMLTYAPPLDSVAFGAVALAGTALMLVAPPSAPPLPPHAACVPLAALLALAAAATVASKRHLSAAALQHMEERLGVERRSREARARMSSLQEVHSMSPITEPELLVAAAMKLLCMFPDASAVAVATLEVASSDDPCTPRTPVEEGDAGAACWEEACSVQRLAHWHVSGGAAARSALEASLPRRVDASSDADACASSAAFVAERAHAHGAVVAYSNDWPAGMQTFSDWAALADGAGADDEPLAARPAMAVTVGVVAGATALGFATLTFRSRLGFKSRPGDASPHVTLCDLGRTLGHAIATCRARAAAASSAAALDASEFLARDVFPAHLVDAVTQRLAKSRRGSGDAGERGGPSSALGAFHPDVTVLFTDVVGWTSIAATRTPQETLELLDSLWQRFDSLTVMHGVYKARVLRVSCSAPVCVRLRLTLASLFRLRPSATATWQLWACCRRARTTRAQRCGWRWTCTRRARRCSWAAASACASASASTPAPSAAAWWATCARASCCLATR
jgi:hypothetical protein